MGVYFTSDLHIGHDKDFIYKPRGFNNIIEMDNAIIKNFTEILTFEDTLYVLGDIVMGGEAMHAEWNRVFYSIPCKNIYYIIGNHDSTNKCEYYDSHNFQCLGYASMLKIHKKVSFYLSHYPTITENFDEENGKGHRVINISGHTHSKEKFYNNNRYIYNVALDAHDCRPVELEQILKDIRTKDKIN